VNRQVGPLARAIDGEEAQHDDVQAIDVVIDVAEGFAGELARGVGGDGLEDRVALGKRHLELTP